MVRAGVDPQSREGDLENDHQQAAGDDVERRQIISKRSGATSTKSCQTKEAGRTLPSRSRYLTNSGMNQVDSKRASSPDSVSVMPTRLTCRSSPASRNQSGSVAVASGLRRPDRAR